MRKSNIFKSSARGMCGPEITKFRTEWRVLLYLLLLSWASKVTGISLSPCGSGNVQEILADQDTRFTCTAVGRVEWRLKIYDNRKDKIDVLNLVICDTYCLQVNTFQGLFIFNVDEVNNTDLIIKPANITRLPGYIMIVNGTLECIRRDADHKSAECGLSYVVPPEDVKCTAVDSSWSLAVSCTIGSVYSSRGLYSCQLYLEKHRSENVTLETVTMVTTPTSEMITNKDVKVSGYCQFNTTLPSQEGNYKFYVSISPGDRSYLTNYKWITIKQPAVPTLSCGPQPYVLENTNITCTCSTTSLGEPAGYLTWSTGNQENQKREVVQEKQISSQKVINFTQFLTLSDHETTLFTCGFVWGPYWMNGETYTAQVGYAAKTPRMSISGQEVHKTVMEGHQVQLLCESDGRPTPTVSIRNNDNSTVIKTDSSPDNYIFIARCDDTAIYTCSASNKFSGHVTTSKSLSLDVDCKPRALGKVIIGHRTGEISFDVIAYPLPYKIEVWYTVSRNNNDEAVLEETKGLLVNVTCTAYTRRRYLSRCTVVVSNLPSQSATTFYKVQVTNEAGDQTFSFGLKFDPEECKNKEGKIHVRSTLIIQHQQDYSVVVPKDKRFSLSTYHLVLVAALPVAVNVFMWNHKS